MGSYADSTTGRDTHSQTHTQLKCCYGTFAEREGLLGHITSPRTQIKLFPDTKHLRRSVHSCKKSTSKIQAALDRFKSLVPVNDGLHHEPHNEKSK